jgi:hydroxyacylglutathione hydrolase
LGIELPGVALIPQGVYASREVVMQTALIPCLGDNYSYLLWKDGQTEAVVVDPGEAGPVLRALETRGLELVAVLGTHHHGDHLGGLGELLRQRSRVRVLCHRLDERRVPQATDPVDDGQRLAIAGLVLSVLHVPGHTRGSVAYWGEGAVFTGDTLFVAGAGRIFEGDYGQLFSSLHQRLATLPPSTLVYCGHEYTENNLRFALHVDPEHGRTKDLAARVAELRTRGEPTVPSTIEQELGTNPFLRQYGARELQRLGELLGTQPEPLAVFDALRAKKDRF